MTKKGPDVNQTGKGEDFECPIPASHEKYTEAHYFISRMIDEYHRPDPFRANLNAFLQALRNVTFMMQSEMASVEGFSTWYKGQQDKMRQDALLRAFVEGRNLVVKRGMLNAKSKVEVGIFRRTELKLVITTDIPATVPSEDALRRGVETFVGSMIDEEHSAIDEQIGVRRRWIVEELGTEEIILLCDQAWSRIGSVLAGAHALLRSRFEAPPEEAHDMERPSLLLESDLDPSLPRKWGWVDMFTYPIKLVGPSGDAEELEALVDTDAAFTSVPADVLESLGVTPHRSISLRSPGGETSEWPVGRVLAEIDEVQEEIMCVFGPIEGAIMGAQTLETFLLQPNKSGDGLTPSEPLLTRHPELYPP